MRFLKTVTLRKKDRNPMNIFLRITVILISLLSLLALRIMHMIIIAKIGVPFTRIIIIDLHLGLAAIILILYFKTQRHEAYQVYSDILFSVTQGRFNLIKSKQILPLCQEGKLLGKIDLRVPEDVNKARELMIRVLNDLLIDPKERYHILLCISEASTNVIKHADHGSLSIRKVKEYLRVCISDCGPGMDLEKLSKCIFLQGYSTKDSMGMGFCFMFKFTERIFLSLSQEGTELILNFKI